MTTYVGKETKNALTNFTFTSVPIVSFELIRAIADIKMAAAITHKKIKLLAPDVADAIVEACKEVSTNKFPSEFVLPSLQGGAGTSINMNVNEVIAKRAEELLVNRNSKHAIHPNDHVNKSQSTNDVNPSALKICSIRLSNTLFLSIDRLIDALRLKVREYSTTLKLGRTHLQDAVPIFVYEEFESYIDTISRDKARIKDASKYFHQLNLGGTAVGNSINASVEYRRTIYETLRTITHIDLQPADNLMAQTSSQTDFVMLSQTLTLLSIDLSKMANDIRLLSSGPLGGIGEYTLPDLQSGSSIMPGKINPISAESINQMYFLVSGNNLTIEHAAHASQLELGIMFPILAEKLINSMNVISEVLDMFTGTCIKTLQVNTERCSELLEKSSAFATLLTPILGYDVVTSVVKESIQSKKNIRQIVLDRNLLDEQTLNQVLYIKISHQGDHK